jgi:hypothetical protein
MTTGFSRESIRFPAFQHIWVPRSSRRAAGAGISMYSPCVAPAILAQRTLYVAVRLLGPKILPGRRESWSEPIEADVWQTFVDEWRDSFGPWDSAALYRRPQLGRTGCTLLLLRRGRGVGFVRISPDSARVAREFSVMKGVHAARPSTFAIARPVGCGTEAGWSWVGTESVPNYPLGALRRHSVRHAVAEEISAILDGFLARPADVPSDWRGSHGDFAPWNLRTELSGRVRVIDWEDAAFAPANVDLLYGDLTSHLTFGTPLPPLASVDSARWMAEVVRRRLAPEEGANSINSRLLELLATVPVA